MGIKTGQGYMNILDRDVQDERSKLGQQAAKLAKAKSGGAGIGGLLGSVVGFMVAGPVGAAIGGGLGALGGSKIGGASAGGQKSIMGGKFMQNSRVNMATDIAKKEFGDVGMAAVTGYMNAGNIGQGLDIFKGGLKAGGGGLAGVLQGSKDLMGSLKPGSFGKPKDLFKQGQKWGMSDVAKAGIKKAAFNQLPGLLGHSDAASNSGSGGGSNTATDQDVSYDMSSNISTDLFMQQHNQNMMSDQADPGDWVQTLDGREWSEMLGKYKDELF